MRRLLIPILFVVAGACAGGGASGGGRPADVAQPAIRVEQVGSVFFGSTSTAPVNFEIAILNRANVPITIREIEISSPGMVQWTLRTRRQRYAETIPPGEARTLGFFTDAVTSTARPSEPLNTRAFVFIEANGKYFREIVFTRG